MEGRKKGWLLTVALVSLICCLLVAMAARVPPIPRTITENAEEIVHGGLTKSQILDEMKEMRIKGKKFKPHFYKPDAFPTPGFVNRRKPAKKSAA